MNLPPQPPLSEEPEQQPARHLVEETPEQAVPAADLHTEETEPAGHVPVQPSSVVNEPAEETLQPAQTVVEEDIPTQPAMSLSSDENRVAALNEAPEDEVLVAGESETIVPEEDPDLEGEDEDEDIESESQGVFIRKGVLIGIACAVVAVALLAALLVFVNRPIDPPSDWIATTPPPVGSNAGKTLYYLHWTNQNSQLTGQMQLAGTANGAPQSLTFPAAGVYNRDNHIIFVVFTVNGQPATLSGKIDNNTLTLNQAGATSTEGQIVFHTGNADDYQKGKAALGKK